MSGYAKDDATRRARWSMTCTRLQEELDCLEAELLADGITHAGLETHAGYQAKLAVYESQCDMDARGLV